MSALAELSVFPLDKGESVSSYVTRAVKIINESGLSYRLGSMGTTIEGELDRVMDVTKQCMEAVAGDSNRVYMTLKIDYRKGASNRLEGKIASVRDKL